MANKAERVIVAELLDEAVKMRDFLNQLQTERFMPNIHHRKQSKDMAEDFSRAAGNARIAFDTNTL